MDGLNHNAEVMTQDFAECLIYLRCKRSTPQPLTKLRFDHVERGFDIAALVIVLEKLRPIQSVEVIHPRPQF
jgi:hypothetical protein